MFADLIRLREEQMMRLHSVKYGDMASDQSQEMARKVAEAVIKFELLSSDTHSKIKVQVVEGESSVCGRERSFTGAFVLYNYARMATIMDRYKQLLQRGTFPSLPAIRDVDFQLLSDEAEWQLVFRFVARFPDIVQEAAALRTKRSTQHVQISVKKICLFLIEMSHLFSSYYSRVKILMSPEPHLLPLICARLHLVSALKQVASNALTLLGIEPLSEL